MKPILNPFTGTLQMINQDGSPGAGIVVKGAYDNATDYTVGDSVSYLSSSYVMYVDAAAGTLPTDTTKWQVLANKGETGATGSSITGPAGPIGTDGPNNITTSTTTNLTGFIKGNGSVVSADNSTYSTDIHSNITALNAVSNTNTGDQTSSNFDIKDLTDSTNLRTAWTGKQSALSEGTDYLNKTHLDAAYAPVSVVNYTLPTSSTSVLGGVKVGDRLSINTGVLSADVQTTDISGKVDKVAGSRLITTAEGTILGNTSNTNSGDNATNTQYSGLTQYTDELAQDATGGMVDTTLTYTDATPLLKVTNPITPQTTGFTISAGTTPKTLTVADTASVTGNNTGDATSLGLHAKADTAGAADTAVALATGTDRTKLDGIAAGAEVNVNADWNSVSGDSQISNKPTLGTAAAKNIPATGNASATEVVYGSDTRLTDARTPASHDNTYHSATYITATSAVAPNAAITAGTKTKISYDIKGLVTSGANATCDDIADGTNTHLVSTAQQTVIGNTSNTNSGDNVEVAAQAIGFTITKGTTAKTLTVPLDASVSGTNTGDGAAGNITTSTTTNLTGYLKGDGTNVGVQTVAALLGVIYPVGCIYSETTGTNPGTTFGFGTWSAYGAGRVMVSKAAAGTFSTAGATGGAETVTLTSAQSGLPAHNHPITYDPAIIVASGASYGDAGRGTTPLGNNTGNNTAANAAESHSNLQPYIVVYVWTRTN